MVVFLLAAAMMLSVGYAALTDVLDINGTADVDVGAVSKVFDENVYFSAAVANRKEGEQTTTNTASVNGDNKDKASFTINNLKTVGDSATVTFTIKNNNTDLDADVDPELSETTKPEYFRIESDWGGEARLIKAGEEETYTVTVTLLKTPQETISGSFFIELTAISQEPTTTETEPTE